MSPKPQDKGSGKAHWSSIMPATLASTPAGQYYWTHFPEQEIGALKAASQPEKEGPNLAVDLPVS